MQRILWHVTMSLDGFIAGPGGEMRWVFEHAGPNPLVEEVLPRIGAILAGRHSFDVGARDTDKRNGAPYGGRWSGPVFVLAHDPPAGADPEITFLAGDIGAAVDTARVAAGGRDVVVFGADVARQCLERGLLDDVVVHVAPVLLGDGIRLHGAPGMARVDLECSEVSRAGQIANLVYRVKR